MSTLAHRGGDGSCRGQSGNFLQEGGLDHSLGKSLPGGWERRSQAEVSAACVNARRG